MVSFGSGHIKSQLLRIGLIRIQFSDDFPLVHYENPVGKAHDLVKFQRNQQYSLILIPFRYQLTVDMLYGSHVQASGRLYSDCG